MARPTKHLTKAAQLEAKQLRTAKYNHSPRGIAVRAASRNARHRRKTAKGSLQTQKPIPALLCTQAHFDLPTSTTGFLDGYSEDFQLIKTPFIKWGRFPLASQPTDPQCDADAGTVEAVLHGYFKQLEERDERLLRTMKGAKHTNSRSSLYEAALFRWKELLKHIGRYSNIEAAVFTLQLRWEARRAYLEQCPT
ncbi:hypothetical protein MKEN_01250400 [Mycena kentingensis (nom. inval.)]|nr:hypothetical protein MKEN_01250400 [Mycena kentingensis (nom. inval.)]